MVIMANGDHGYMYYGQWLLCLYKMVKHDDSCGLLLGTPCFKSHTHVSTLDCRYPTLGLGRTSDT